MLSNWSFGCVVHRASSVVRPVANGLQFKARTLSTGSLISIAALLSSFVIADYLVVDRENLDWNSSCFSLIESNQLKIAANVF